MPRLLTTFACLLLLLLTLAGGAAAGARAAPAGACSIEQAKADLAAAHRAAVRAAARESEARRILDATRRYSDLYGAATGRWVRCARRNGWSWSSVPDLMYVIERESAGDPGARNASGAAGLLQLMGFWYDGTSAYGWVFDPFYGPANLDYGQRIYRRAGWSPWDVT